MAPTPLTEFHLFPSLPPEIRLLIWELLPQPQRVIGYVPCSNCNSEEFGKVPEPEGNCPARKHPDWRLRYIVQPRDTAIFPPLHACRESRALWLPRYFRPPHRHLSLRDYGFPNDQYNLRFDVPFVSYETDMFAAFFAWTRQNVDLDAQRREALLDPFIGLDRTLIQHIAVGEEYYKVARAVAALNFRALPSLRAMTVLSFGLNPDPAHSICDWRAEMAPADLQYFRCGLRAIPMVVAAGNLFFSHPDFRLIYVDSPERRTPFDAYLAMLNGWLWHAVRYDITEDAADLGIDDDLFTHTFQDFVLDHSAPDICPLWFLPGCGPGGHTSRDMASWTPSFTVDYMLIGEESWLRMLDSLSLFDTENGSDEQLEAIEELLDFDFALES